MFRLDGKTAFVTGAGSGIGEATASALAAAGARVVVADRDAAGGQRVTGAIRESGGAAEYYSFDVTDEAACTAAAAHVGDVDVPVNNAGVGHVGTILQAAGTDLDRLYSVNVRGVFNVSKAFIAGMLARRKGSIVNIA